FALQNGPSEAALRTLGYRFETAEQFQEAAAELREALGLEDFIALDYLLYFGPAAARGESRARPAAFWWVNQGQSYETERDGGFMWAPLTHRAGRQMAHHRAMADLGIGDVVFHYAQGHVRAIGRVTGAAERKTHPTYRANEGEDVEGRLVPVE